MTALEFNYKLIGMQTYLEYFAKKLTSNEEDANDLVQETNYKALLFREKYVHHTNFKAWLFTIMKNIFINNYRRNKKAQTFIDTTDNLYHMNSRTDSFRFFPILSYVKRRSGKWSTTWRMNTGFHSKCIRRVSNIRKLPMNLIFR
jgi:RNA polymerase sigma factor (sigma-70 family)